MRAFLAVTIGLVRLATAALPLPLSSANRQPGKNVRLSGDGIVPGEYIIELAEGSHFKREFTSPHAQLYHELRRRDVLWELKREYTGLFTGAVVKLERGADFFKLAKTPGVRSISPVQTYSIPPFDSVLSKRDEASKTPRNNNQEGFVATGIDKLHAAGYTGKGVKIAILDTGIDHTHPALGGKLGPGNKILGSQNYIQDNRTDDCVGHGTFLAGVIGANPGSNPHNITGIAYGANITSYRVVKCNGRTDSKAVIDALNKAYEDGNDIFNLSFACTRCAWPSPETDSLVSKLVGRGRIVVRGVGNDGVSGPWRSFDSPGAIVPGNVRTATKSRAMFYESTWGPTGDLYMSPALAAPGTDYLSTWPVANGSYAVRTGTSISTPFIVGVAALLLEARGKSEATSKAVRAMFMNTALPLSRDDLVESAARQGAGMIQAFDAVKSTASMLPAEMLMNDTAHYRGSHELTIRNDGNKTATYNLTHVPAGTVPTYDTSRQQIPSGEFLTSSNLPASVSITPSTVVVPPGKTATVKVDIQLPAGIKEELFPVFSGSIVAGSSDGTKLRSTYMGLGAAIRNMKVIHPVKQPFIGDTSKARMDENATFTMKNESVPTLWFNLAANTPFIQVDLARALDNDNTKSQSLATIYTELWTGRDAQTGLSQVNLGAFENGTAIPDGRYQVSLWALVNTGDPTKDADWETWQSPFYNIKRSS